MNILKALKRSPLGLDLYLWLTYRTLLPRWSEAAVLADALPAVRGGPNQGGRQCYRPEVP